MPILLWLLADILQIKGRFGAYIIARNWSSVVVAFAFIVPAIAELSGLIIHEITIFTEILLLGFVLFYHFKIAMVTLEKSWAFCAALVFADFVLAVFIGELFWGVFLSTTGLAT